MWVYGCKLYTRAFDDVHTHIIPRFALLKFTLLQEVCAQVFCLFYVRYLLLMADFRLQTFQVCAVVDIHPPHARSAIVFVYQPPVSVQFLSCLPFISFRCPSLARPYTSTPTPTP